MVILVGINGFGRIGRIVFRTCLESKVLQVSAINDPAISVEYICYLIKFDSTHGKYKGNVTYSENKVTVQGTSIRVHHEKLPSTIPWSETNTKYVIEASGLFTCIEKASGHLNSKSVSLVFVTSPSLDIPMLVVGVNEDTIVKSGKKILSCASSTLYCLAPIVKVLDDKFGIEEGFVTSIHAMTPSLKPLDGLCIKGKHWRDHRGIHQNIIPASTGACKALAKIMPHVKDKITGLAFRVPIVNVSVLDLTIRLSKNTTLKSIMKQVEVVGRTTMINIIKVSKEEAVSSDFAGDNCSCIVDATSCLQLRPNFFKIVCWYENEYSYACRVIDSILISENLIQYKLMSATSILKPSVTNRGDVPQKTVVKEKLRFEALSSPQDRAKDKSNPMSISSNCSSHDLRSCLKYAQRDTSLKAIEVTKDKKQDLSQYTLNNAESQYTHKTGELYIDIEGDELSDFTPLNTYKPKQNCKDKLLNKDPKAYSQPISVQIMKKEENEQPELEKHVMPKLNINRIVNTSHQLSAYELAHDEQRVISPLQKVLINTKENDEIFKRQAKPKPGSIYQRSAAMVRESSGFKTKLTNDQFEFMKKSYVNNHDEESVLRSSPSVVTTNRDSGKSSNTRERLDTIKKEFTKMVNMTEELLKKSCNTAGPSSDSLNKSDEDDDDRFIKFCSQEDLGNINYKTSSGVIEFTEPISDDNDTIPFLDEKLENKLTKASVLHQRAIEMIKEIRESSKRHVLNDRKNRNLNVLTLNQAKVETTMRHNLQFQESKENDSRTRVEIKDAHNLMAESVSSAMYLRFIDEKFSNEKNKNSDINSTLIQNNLAELVNVGRESVKSDKVSERQLLPEHMSTNGSQDTKIVFSESSETDLSNTCSKNMDKDVYDKLDSVSVSNSDNSFHGRQSHVLAISDLTNSIDDFKNIEQVCQILEVSDELSDKLLSKLDTEPNYNNNNNNGPNKWSFKDFCKKVKLNDFCNDVLTKNNT